MGIPSYFKHIIKQYGDIFTSIQSCAEVHNLYIDSNSVIYDALRRLTFGEQEMNDQFEERLMEETCNTLLSYIETIRPTKRVFIAFDGVAPVAKLEQQRQRRNKSVFFRVLEGEVKERWNIPETRSWDQTAITPGTAFMAKLDTYVDDFFRVNAPSFCNEIIISGSSHVGEGEHKIFSYIRDHPEPHRTQTSLVYGLDADLIMLCLQHLSYSKKIYLFREIPDYERDLQRTLEGETLCVMQIQALSQIIVQEMTLHKPTQIPRQKIQDYIFISFLLGNDFLPHFPALNIRTNGIDILIGAYREVCPPNKSICTGKGIDWKMCRSLIEHISQKEFDFIQHEYKTMRRWKNMAERPPTTYEEHVRKMQLIPCRSREREEFIDPSHKGWEFRYYKALFDIEIDDEYRKKICRNYLEGLEWTYHYYREGCRNYQWSYRYHYPPLLKDLVRYMPQFETNFVEENYHTVTPLQQLCYVIPKEAYHLLPIKAAKQLHKQREAMEEVYKEDKPFVWAFCKYLWESHITLPDVPIEAMPLE